MPISRRALLELLPAGIIGLGPASLASRELVGRHRARALGIEIGRLPAGPQNAITDVPGVEVGHSTIIRGSGKLDVGRGPVRTGVTAIWPHRQVFTEYVPCGTAVPNGNGELSGLLQARALGVVASPICLTNTSSVGEVYDAMLGMMPRDELPGMVPIVGETWDAFLNDIEGRHVSREHVIEAVEGASGGRVEEGCVGGGTGMVCYGFKGGIGTASRRLKVAGRSYTVGALVQANHGAREQLRIDGVPVGRELPERPPGVKPTVVGGSSILMILGTDAPLLDFQLDRVARRAVHGLAKTGSISGNSSGDFALAFSTANRIPRQQYWTAESYSLSAIEQFDINLLFEGAAEAVEEAIINALFMATDMEGRDLHTVYALPLSRTLKILQRYGRLDPSSLGGEHDGL